MLKSLALVSLLALSASAQPTEQSPAPDAFSVISAFEAPLSTRSLNTSSNSLYSIPSECADKCKDARSWRCSKNTVLACSAELCPKSEDLMKPCLECAHQSDIYKKFTQACKDAGFQVTSGAGAITVSLGAVAAGAALAAWF